MRIVTRGFSRTARALYNSERKPRTFSRCLSMLMQEKPSASNALFSRDQTLRAVEQALLEAQSQGLISCPVPVPHTDDKLNLPRKVLLCGVSCKDKQIESLLLEPSRLETRSSRLELNIPATSDTSKYSIPLRNSAYGRVVGCA